MPTGSSGGYFSTPLPAFHWNPCRSLPLASLTCSQLAGSALGMNGTKGFFKQKLVASVYQDFSFPFPLSWKLRGTCSTWALGLSSGVRFQMPTILVFGFLPFPVSLPDIPPVFPGITLQINELYSKHVLIELKIERKAPTNKLLMLKSLF